MLTVREIDILAIGYLCFWSYSTPKEKLGIDPMVIDTLK
jgi:hypothetical protein